jgi:integrase
MSYLVVACGRGNRPCWKPLSEGVNLTPRTVDALKAHRKKQLASGVGTPVNPENLVKRSFKVLLQRAGLPEIRFHDLRHTCATLLLGRGMHPKIVQELLGHVTIRHYSYASRHLFPLPALGGRLGDR